MVEFLLNAVVFFTTFQALSTFSISETNACSGFGETKALVAQILGLLRVRPGPVRLFQAGGLVIPPPPPPGHQVITWAIDECPLSH